MASNKGKLPDYSSYKMNDDKFITGRQEDGDNEPGLFKERCMNILNSLQSCQLINSFDGEKKLQELVLMFDNIKLRYAIWLRLNRKLEQKDYHIVMDILERLDIFLFHETESMYQGCAHGMMYHEETATEQNHLEREEESTPLYKCFRNHAEKYINECQTRGLLTDFYNTWIVIDSSICLKFLATIDGLVEELFANTKREIRSALAHGYASSATKEMSTETLQLVQLSGFSDTNLICQAAQSRLRSQTATHTLGESSNVTFASNTRDLFVDPTADAESLADSSPPILTPTTSEASLDVEERFARIADRSMQSLDINLMQDGSLNQLAQRRILAELRQADSAPSFASIACIDNSISNLLGIISGPPDTPYEKGIFFIKIEIPEQYPLQVARFKFITKIHHPNINSAGEVCVTVNDVQWAISCSIWGLLTSIYALLATPDADHALVPSIGREYKVNRKQFDATAKYWTDCYADRDWPTQDELSASIPQAVPKKIKSAKPKELPSFWERTNRRKPSR